MLPAPLRWVTQESAGITGSSPHRADPAPVRGLPLPAAGMVTVIMTCDDAGRRYRAVEMPRTHTATVPDLIEVSVPTGATMMVVSDLHLPDRATLASGRAVEVLTERLVDGEPVHTLVLDGDILELLAFAEAGPGQILDAHPALVRALSQVSADGGQVIYVLGNHDGDLAWNAEAVAEITSRIPVTLCLAVDILSPGPAGGPPRRIRVEHGHQLDPYNRFTDQRNQLDSPLGHHVVRQVLPRIEALGSGWLQNSRELVDVAGFPSFMASRLAYRILGRHLWWLLAPFAIIAVLHAPEVVEVLSSSSTTNVWARRTQTLAVAGVADLVVLALVVWVLTRRAWRSISALGPDRRGSEQNHAAQQHATHLVDTGWIGLITGHSHSPELRPTGTGFYANTGSTTMVVQPVSAHLHLPPVYVRSQQVCWVECRLAENLSVQLIVARFPMPGGTRLERLATIGRRAHRQVTTSVADWPRTSINTSTHVARQRTRDDDGTAWVEDLPSGSRPPRDS